MRKNLYMSLMVLIFGLGFYLYYNFVYMKQPRRLQNLRGEIEELNEKLISAQILSRELDQVAKLIERNLALSIRDSLAEDASMPFMNDITFLLDELGIKLIKLDPDRKVNMRDYIKSPYNLTIECTYEELGQFINNLEKSERLITVEGFEIDNAIRKIRGRKPGAKVNTHRMIINLSTLTLIKRR